MAVPASAAKKAGKETGAAELPKLADFDGKLSEASPKLPSDYLDDLKTTSSTTSTAPPHSESLPETAPALSAGNRGRIAGESVLEDLIRKSGGCAVMDGGLATELERRGANIDDPLWSAKCLVESASQNLIREVHYDYYRAGADVCASASYQATIQGFVARGSTNSEAEALLLKSVELTIQARNRFWDKYQADVHKYRQNVPSDLVTNVAIEIDKAKAMDKTDETKETTQIDTTDETDTTSGRDKANKATKMNERSVGKWWPDRQRPLVAASVGSYGAFLADGSEYHGQYGPGMTKGLLKDFHRRRLEILGHSGADIIALETIPCKLETEALAELLTELSLPIPAWMSFNSKDGVNCVSGDPMEQCALIAEKCNEVVAVGINCTPPRWISGLIKTLREVTQKPVVVYPNSGETYDAEKKQWVESTGVSDDDFAAFSPEWRNVGANLIGGCCRTCPETICCIRNALSNSL